MFSSKQYITFALIHPRVNPWCFVYDRIEKALENGQTLHEIQSGEGVFQKGLIDTKAKLEHTLNVSGEFTTWFKNSNTREIIPYR